MLITDQWSSLIWDFYLQDRTAVSIIAAIDALLQILSRQYKVTPKVIECDNELTQVKPRVYAWLVSKGFKVEPSAPQTQSQNGSAERSGGIIKEKARSMRASAKFPRFLWPEISRAAVYLYNRTPKYIHHWKSLYDRFYTRMAHREGVVVDHRKLDQTHLWAYGCKAYAMTTVAQKKQQRLQRLNPKAWIGFLIGYSSLNIYRIWIPAQNKVISTRDVIFNKDRFFSRDIKALKDDLLYTSTEEFAELLESITLPELGLLEDVPLETTAEDDAEFAVPIGLDIDPDEDSQDQGPQDQCVQDDPGPYPIPEQTPPVALLAYSI